MRLGECGTENILCRGGRREGGKEGGKGGKEGGREGRRRERGLERINNTQSTAVYILYIPAVLCKITVVL